MRQTPHGNHFTRERPISVKTKHKKGTVSKGSLHCLPEGSNAFRKGARCFLQRSAFRHPSQTVGLWGRSAWSIVAKYSWLCPRRRVAGSIQNNPPQHEAPTKRGRRLVGIYVRTSLNTERKEEGLKRESNETFIKGTHEQRFSAKYQFHIKPAKCLLTHAKGPERAHQQFSPRCVSTLDHTDIQFR